MPNSCFFTNIIMFFSHKLILPTLVVWLMFFTMNILLSMLGMNLKLKNLENVALNRRCRSSNSSALAYHQIHCQFTARSE